MHSPTVIGNNTAERKKCCEIFFFPNGTFSLICSFCSEKYSTFSAFDVHINEKHSAKPIIIIKRESSTNCDDDTKENLLEIVQENTGSHIPATDWPTSVHESVPKRWHEAKLDDEPIKSKRKSKIQRNIADNGDSVVKSGETSRPKRTGRKIKSQKPVDDENSRDSREATKETVKKKPITCKKKRKTYAESVSVDDKCVADDDADKPSETKSAKKIHQCVFCGKVFCSKRVRLDHENTHTGKNPYECEICSKSFSSSMSLHRHINIHNGNQRKMCAECGKICSSGAKLTTHIREKHLPDTDPRRFFCCTLCDGKFKTSHQLSDHNMATHKANDTLFTCDYCQRQFKTRKYIVQHMEILHTEAKVTFACGSCPRVFRRQIQRDDHENTHTGRRPHHCKFCPKEFMNFVTLRRHYKTHSSDGSSNLPPIVMHECCFCPKTFRRKKERDNHLNTHTGSQQLQCAFCPKSYFNLRHFNRHVNKNHPNDRNLLEALTNAGVTTELRDDRAAGDKQNCKTEPFSAY